MSQVAYDLTILHQIGLQRYSITVLRRIQSTLAVMRQDIERQIRDKVADGDNERGATSLRLQSLLAQIEATQIEAHRAIAQDLDLTPVVEVEAAFATQLAQTQVSLAPMIGADVRLATVSGPQLYSAVMSSPMQGKVLREWTKQLETGDRARVRQQVTLGYLEGESVGQITKRVRGAVGMTERGAEALVRTSITHINARAVEHNAKLNPELFKQYQWISVLDNRTTDICKSRAGKVYNHGANPLPPAHPNCRSAIYSLVRGVPAATNLDYDAWLRDQPDNVVKDILGPSKFKLWKGGLTMDKFVDGNRALTLKQLRDRDVAMFDRLMNV